MSARAALLAPPLAGLAAATALVVAGGLAAADITLFRAHATAWTSALLALPALCLFLARTGRRPLGRAWRLWWTAGWIMVAAHAWWGLGGLHGWDLGSVFHRQGNAIALSIVLLEVVWAVDVALAWARADWAEARGWFRAWQRAAFGIAVACFIVSLLVFRNDPQSFWIGLVMAVALGLTLLRRLAEGERP